VSLLLRLRNGILPHLEFVFELQSYFRLLFDIVSKTVEKAKNLVINVKKDKYGVREDLKENSFLFSKF